MHRWCSLISLLREACGLCCRVSWGNHFSDWFSITAGVRQGGVLSPDFYSIYVDELLRKLEKLNKGCYFCGVFAASFFYADDMAILAPSIKGLRALLDVCLLFRLGHSPERKEISQSLFRQTYKYFP